VVAIAILINVIAGVDSAADVKRKTELATSYNLHLVYVAEAGKLIPS